MVLSSYKQSIIDRALKDYNLPYTNRARIEKSLQSVQNEMAKRFIPKNHYNIVNRHKRIMQQNDENEIINWLSFLWQAGIYPLTKNQSHQKDHWEFEFRDQYDIYYKDELQRYKIDKCPIQMKYEKAEELRIHPQHQTVIAGLPKSPYGVHNTFNDEKDIKRFFINKTSKLSYISSVLTKKKMIERRNKRVQETKEQNENNDPIKQERIYALVREMQGLQKSEENNEQEQQATTEQVLAGGNLQKQTAFVKQKNLRNTLNQQNRSTKIPIQSQGFFKGLEESTQDLYTFNSSPFKNRASTSFSTKRERIINSSQSARVLKHNQQDTNVVSKIQEVPQFLDDQNIQHDLMNAYQQDLPLESITEERNIKMSKIRSKNIQSSQSYHRPKQTNVRINFSRADQRNLADLKSIKTHQALLSQNSEISDFQATDTIKKAMKQASQFKKFELKQPIKTAKDLDTKNYQPLLTAKIKEYKLCKKANHF